MALEEVEASSYQVAQEEVVKYLHSYLLEEEAGAVIPLNDLVALAEEVSSFHLEVPVVAAS